MAVRRERVILELQDDFTGPIIRAAAATELLNKRLDSLSGEAVRSSKATRDIDKNTDSLGKTAGRAEKDIDKLSGRLRILADVAAVLGPSVVPIGALAIPAVTGLTSALGFLTVGIGASAFAFQGLGDAMKAVEKARLQPTAENLDALRVVMAGLTPETRDFVAELRTFLPILEELQGTAAAGLFPGLGEGLEQAKKALPQIERVIEAITAKVGEIGADAGRSLGEGDWDQFFNFIATEGPAALGKMAEAAGHLAHGLAGLWMSTQPLNNDFLDWLIKATDSFDKWSNNLGQSEGFHEFIDYVRTVGPQVGETLGALADALVKVTQAVAPLGGPSLKIIEALAKAIGTIADSPIGTPLLGLVSTMSALRLATRGYQTFQEATFGNPAVSKVRAYGSALAGVTTAQQRASMSASELTAMESKRTGVIKSGNADILRGATTLGAFALQASGAADKLHLTNLASLALAGSFAGPWGTAIGAGVGGLMDLSSALTGANDGTADLQHKIDLLIASAGPAASAQIGALTSRIKELQAAQANQDNGWSLGNIPGNLLNGLNPFDDDRSASQKQIDALKARRKEIESQVEVDNALSASQGNAAQATAEMTARTQEQASALIAARSASESANQAFLNYGNTIGDTKKTLDEFIEDFQLKARALADFGNNTETALGRGLNAKVIEWLRSQGPEGALRLQQLAHGAKGDIDQMNRAWRQFAVAGKDNVAAGVAVQRQIQRTQQSARDATAKRYMFQLDANTDPAKAAVSRLVAQLSGLHINIPVTASTNANLGEAAALGGKGHSSGGYTGDGGKFEPRGIVHAGEVVLPQEVVNRDWSMLSTRYGYLPGFAGGGVVGRSSSKPDVLTKQEYRDALSALIDGLNSTLGLGQGSTGPGAEVRAAFKDFAKTIHDNGGTVGKGFHVLEERLVRAAVALDRQKMKLDTLNDSLDSVKQSADSLASSVQSGFNTDIFSSSYDPFAASDQATRDAGGTPATHSQAAIIGAGIQQVFKDAQDVAKFATDIEQLKQRGFGGPGLEALANSNNLTAADSLLGLSPQALAQVNTAFSVRSQAQAGAGQVVSAAVFGDEMAKLRSEVVGVQSSIATLTKVEQTGVAAIQGLPPRIGTSVTHSLNGVAASASQKGGR